MKTGRKRSRWLSILKWIGFYFLANLMGGVLEAIVFGGPRHGGAVFAALIFLVMIVYSVVKHRRQRRITTRPML